MDNFENHELGQENPPELATQPTNPQTGTEKTPLTFEQSLARLEEIVNLLGNGRAPLADSLALFEEGAGLLKYCNLELAEAEQKVEVLLPQQEVGGV